MCNDFDFFIKPIILVTGFGPFANHPVNASWEAVKLLNKQEIEEKHNVELVQLEIPVTYENVDEFAPALWETHTPKLMIHVGVSSVAKCVTLESQAHRKGYQRLDYFDRCPDNHTCPAEGAIRLHTKFDVDRMCNEFNNTMKPHEMEAVTSKDAGRYLCEYIYYWSLSAGGGRALFVHVPAAAELAPARAAAALQHIIHLCLAQIDEAERSNDVTQDLRNVTLED